jgi:hypothetical protein
VIGVQVRRNGGVEIDRFGIHRELEAGRHDPDDHEWRAVQVERAAGKRGVPVERRAPAPVRDHHGQ